ncbi:glycosyltransferase family 2 protein [Rhizobium sp. AG855]|uniref:glycosyltransferase family 2 protein n=1 Tax=Rhizobium sp. AG855 TaxID=2183898 RepID=UPI000E7257C0|nr:glycosyltransferase family 2 protein [Rhizobium sp. AG855]RKE79225.1 GT2 family glycosyltransferase [Rhizobium sp. AG855]
MLKLGVVILTYNSDRDLPVCLDGILSQQGVAVDIIVVDNGSHSASRARMRQDVRDALPDVWELRAGVDIPSGYRHGDGLFVLNDRNAGYSAGNNIGARLAVSLGCEAVLIVNPDIRIDDRDYLLTLAKTLFRSDRNAVAASAIWSLAGVNENPMFEPGFVREILSPVFMLLAGLSRRRFGGNPKPGRPTGNDKLSGCCFLVRSTFLERIGYFDENVFLYCEEAILAEQVRRAGLNSVYTGEISAVHAHRTAEKGDPVRRLSLWAQSRRYYHARYRGTGRASLVALRISYGVMLAMARMRAWVQGGFR